MYRVCHSFHVHIKNMKIAVFWDVISARVNFKVTGVRASNLTKICRSDIGMRVLMHSNCFARITTTRDIVYDATYEGLQ
jgi:hypothetical protein